MCMIWQDRSASAIFLKNCFFEKHRLLRNGTARITVMTPGKHGCFCVAIVLFVIVLVNGATPEHQKSQDEKVVKTQETLSKTQQTASGNSKVPTGSKSTRVFDCVEEDTECTKDKFGYEAIGQLHRLIDDDRNGNVDQSESDEFLRDELQYEDGFERHSLFHNNDKLISVDDLWRAWKYSPVYNWTVDDVIDWLQTEVDLPQYSNMFMQNAVNGPFLPRLASSNTFMSTVLGIKNPVHKQKLALKAMDTVLFGAPPKRHSYVKDLVLVILLVVAVGGCWFAYLHHRYSQEQVRKMMIDLESLQKAEEALMDVQRKLEDAENKQVSSKPRPPHDFKEGTAVPDADLPIPHSHHHSGASGEGTRQIKEELAATLLALQQAETQLENSWAPPGELQAWLQLTHELEQVHYNAKRQVAERQFQSAKEVCDKIKRRNKAFFGSLRMAHSNSLDEIDMRILDARVALEEVKQDLQERTQRWHNIERLCGFPIITNPGLATLSTLLHGPREGSTNGARLPGPVSVDEADEDMPPAVFQCHLSNGLYRPRAFSTADFKIGYPPMPHNMSNKAFIRQRTAMGSTGSLSHLSRTGVNVNAAFNSHPSHSTFSPTQRGSIDYTDTPSPTSSSHTNPVNFHLGDQHQDRGVGLSYMSQVLGANHIRSKSITPSTVSSINSVPASAAGYHGHSYNGGATAQSTQVAYAHSRSLPVEDSDDNLSQADSLPRSVSSGAVRERLRVNNNGLDLVNHTGQAMGSEGDILGPSLLQKKPSKRKKLLNMFRKSTKQKPV